VLELVAWSLSGGARWCCLGGHAVLNRAPEQDNGPGMGEQRPGSLGLRLVRSLAGQLSGRITVDSSSSGTTVTLIFPMIE